MKLSWGVEFSDSGNKVLRENWTPHSAFLSVQFTFFAKLYGNSKGERPHDVCLILESQKFGWPIYVSVVKIVS